MPRTCDACGAELVPKVRGRRADGAAHLEWGRDFERRRYCGRACMTAAYRRAGSSAQRSTQPRRVAAPFCAGCGERPLAKGCGGCPDLPARFSTEDGRRLEPPPPPAPSLLASVWAGYDARTGDGMARAR